MVSLWGSKNGEDQNDGDATIEGDDGRQAPRHGDSGRGRNPDERTRLLPPRSDGYLDPDDPAVGTLAILAISILTLRFPGLTL